MEERMSRLETQLGFLVTQVASLNAKVDSIVDQISSKKCKGSLQHSSKVDDPTEEQTGVEKDNPLQAAEIDSLLPPEMRQMIIKKLDLDTLKKCRLVSHRWKIQTTPILANRCSIDLYSFFNINLDQDDVIKFPEHKITDGLIKNIKTSTSGDFYELKLQLNVLTEFCKKYGSQIRGMKVDAYRYNKVKIIPFFYQILSELCPNLQELHLTDIHNDESGNIAEKQETSEFSKPLALTSFKLDSEGTPNVLPTFANFLDKIIFASPQLETLKVNMDYCPKDLSNQSKLKTLKLKETSYSKILQIEFGDQNKIKNLTVFAPKELSLRNAKYHKFPELQYLKIKIPFVEVGETYEPSYFAAYMLMMSPALDLLILDKEENLERKQYEKQIRVLFQQNNDKNLKLSTLKLWGDLKDENLFESIANLKKLPNLSTLEISIGKFGNMQKSEVQLKLDKWFEILAKLKLAHLDLTIKCNITMSQLAYCILNNPGLFRGLETLKITLVSKFHANDLYDPYNMDSFKNALKMTSTLKKAEFINFHMRSSTTGKLMKFVTENGLPVKID